VRSKVNIFAFGGIFVILLGSGTQNRVSASPWSWTPSLTFSERYDDNLFLARENRNSDFVSIFTPQFRVSSPVEQRPRYIQYRAEVERYTRHSELNTVNHFSDLEWTSPLSKTAMLTLADHFGFTSDSTEISTLGVAVPRGNTYSNNSAIGLQLSWLVLSYQYGLQAFEDASLNDSQSHTFDEQWTLPLSARYSLTQSYRMRYFVQDGGADLRSHSVGTGLRFLLTPTFTVGLEGGIAYWRSSTDNSFRTSPMGRLDLEKSFRDLRLSFSLLEDIQTQFRGSVQYALRNTVLRLDYSKELTAGGGVLGTVTDRQEASINLQQAITRRTNLTVMAGYGTSQPIHREQDRFTSYRGETDFNYVIRPWLRMGVHYGYLKQDADGTTQQEFRRHQGTVSLTATLP